MSNLTIMEAARRADIFAAAPEAIAFFGEPEEGEFVRKAERLEAGIALCSQRQSWPREIEGHWRNLREAVRWGITPDALDRAEEAILSHAETALERYVIERELEGLRYRLSH